MNFCVWVLYGFVVPGALVVVFWNAGLSNGICWEYTLSLEQNIDRDIQRPCTARVRKTAYISLPTWPLIKWFFWWTVRLSVYLDTMKVWKEGGVNHFMVRPFLGYRSTKTSFWLVLVGLGSPFYSELVSILLAGVIHSLEQKRWGKPFYYYKMVSPDWPWEFQRGYLYVSSCCTTAYMFLICFLL